MRRDLTRLDQVARNLQVDRPLVPHRRAQHPVNLGERRQRIVQHRRGRRELLEHLQLRVKAPHLVVQQRVARPLRHARRTAQHDHGRLLGIGPRHAVGAAQAAHAVGHAQAAQPVDPRIGVGREARAVLPRHPHQLDRALLQHLVQPQHVVARDPEAVADAHGMQPVDQIPPNRHLTIEQPARLVVRWLRSNRRHQQSLQDRIK